MKYIKKEFFSFLVLTLISIIIIFPHSINYIQSENGNIRILSDLPEKD